MSGYDTKTNIEQNWSYRELLEMIMIEDAKAIAQYKHDKKIEHQRELEDMLRNGG